MSYGNDPQPAVLIVEDDPAISRLIKLTLESDDIDALIAPSGEEALQLLDEGGPSLVVLDMRLPDMDGAALVPHLKTDYGARVLVLTASSSPNVRRAAFQSQADDFCLKPFDPDDLADRIRFLASPPEARGDDAVEVAPGVEVSFTARRLWHEGEEVRLGRTYWDMFALLVSRAGECVSHVDLASRIPGGWSDNTLVEHMVADLNERLTRGQPPLILQAEGGFILPPFKPSA